MTHREALEREERVLYEIAEDLHLSDDETRAASVYMICGELRRIAAALASEEKRVAWWWADDGRPRVATDRDGAEGREPGRWLSP